MSQAIRLQASGEQRRFMRVTSGLPVQFRYDSTDGSGAEMVDIGRGGMCLRSVRYLRPGTSLVLQFVAGAPEVNAEVVWCRPSRKADGFWMGVRILYDEAAVWDAMSSLMHRSLETSGALAGRTPRCEAGSSGPCWAYAPGTSMECSVPRAETPCAQE